MKILPEPLNEAKHNIITEVTFKEVQLLPFNWNVSNGSLSDKNKPDIFTPFKRFFTYEKVDNIQSALPSLVDGL